MAFNLSQKRAVEHREGPALILAGPGSGKTLVITERTKYLIESCGINPSNILVITFTKAAAAEMQDRFTKLMKGVRAPVAFGTFHSIYFRILMYAYGYDGSNILREDQKNLYLKEIIEKTKLELEDEAEFLSSIAGEISSVKGERIDLRHYYSKNCSDEVFKEIYLAYENKLQAANLIDFDDMLVMCYELFRQRKDILEAWSTKYQYILVDEFQDINRVQFDIVCMLASPKNNLFIVGDDDQSIYRFRGAKPEIMLDFEKDYPEAVKILLDTNYRSSKHIVEASLRLIDNNKIRFEKKIQTVHEMGVPIHTRLFPSPKEENEQIIGDILSCVKNGIPFSDIAVLFRTNMGPRLLIEKMLEYNIPFIMKDRIPNLFEHWVAKDIITYIKIASGSRQRSDFLQIINRPKRYISRDSLCSENVSFLELKQFYVQKPWIMERLEKLEFDLTMLSKMPPFGAVNYIRKGMDYESFLKEYAQYRRMNPEELIEKLDGLQESAADYKTYEDWFSHIEKYTKELMEQVKNRNQNLNGVTLSTMHSSKGLEYKVVFLMDINEGIVPHHKAVLEADLEEERRLFYVGMTRAKELLSVYSIKERYNKKLEPSRFIGEYQTNLNLLEEGAQITHVKYGTGIIRKKAGGKIIVYFERYHKEAVLDIKYCVAQQLITIKE